MVCVCAVDHGPAVWRGLRNSRLSLRPPPAPHTHLHTYIHAFIHNKALMLAWIWPGPPGQASRQQLFSSLYLQALIPSWVVYVPSHHHSSSRAPLPFYNTSDWSTLDPTNERTRGLVLSIIWFYVPSYPPPFLHHEVDWIHIHIL